MIILGNGGVSMKVFSVTDIGEKRKVNQDYVFSTDDKIGSLPNLLIVADGMGGHKAGDYASRFSVEYFLTCIKSTIICSPFEVFKNSIAETNEKLLKKANEKSEYEGMGTTFVAATYVDKTLYVANIGDSRLYIINDKITQITKDHSLVEEMVRSGKLNREEARFHPNKNIITRALGVKETVEADCFEVPVDSGDIVLMCSDGLSNMLEDSEILNIVNENKEDIEKTAKRLIDEANHHGGRDNISVVLAKL